ncbi:piggyBac transposable element-derived protein 3-like [Metopolophium dirhodum]|uniref:piggyBac transposable element-derived protein 3-like n=1 Tax=Metopolophium dirhodum TaxID=44670 RepID=UPI0029900DCC|nr:piggyBac transposable element-derived protein 3-like [Metopolophium dirhodum]
MASSSKSLCVNDIINLLEADELSEDTIFLEPPDENITDEDSDNDEHTGDINHLPASVLKANVILPKEILNTDNYYESKKKKVVTTKKNRVVVGMKKSQKDSSQIWREGDLETPKITELWGPDENSKIKYGSLAPFELFELFFDDQVFDSIAPDTNNGLVSNAMRRNRFDDIFHNLHFSNNNNLDNSDKYAKIRPLITMINTRFLMHAPHEEFHSIDESMVPYYGKHGCKQFVRGKPIRFGFKVWVGTLRLGYALWISPYQGKNTGFNQTDVGLGGSVILAYANQIINHRPAPYHLVFDNFFTGVTLLEKLKSINIRATGTIRSNRVMKCPIDFGKMKKQPRGSSCSFVSNNAIFICCWRDNNIVCLASNTIGTDPISVANRWSTSEKKRLRISQPNIVSVYNKNMGGVDRMDQNISQYRIGIRGKKWYSSIVLYIIDLAVQNAWQLHRMYNKNKMDQLAFRRSIVISYLTRYKTEPTPGRSGGKPSSVIMEIRYDKFEHYLIPQDSQTRCGQCHQKTTTRCMKCNIGVHAKCNVLYHTK